MSTSALIELQSQKGIGYTLSHDGYPDEVIGYLEEKVEEARNQSEDSLLQEVKELLDEDAEDNGMLLEQVHLPFTGHPDYEYRIESDGEVTVVSGED